MTEKLRRAGVLLNATATNDAQRGVAARSWPAPSPLSLWLVYERRGVRKMNALVQITRFKAVAGYRSPRRYRDQERPS